MTRHSRASMEGVMAIMALSDAERRAVVAELDLAEEESRQANYTYHACPNNKTCKGFIRTIAQMATDVNMCGPCWEKSKRRNNG